jgi:hypothetical protein
MTSNSINPTNAYDFLREAVSPEIGRGEIARIIELIAEYSDMDKDQLLENLNDAFVKKYE